MMGIGFTLITLKALNGFGINCFVHIKGVQALVFRRSAIIACVATWTGLVRNSLEFPMLLGFPKLAGALQAMLATRASSYLFCGGFVAF